MSASVVLSYRMNPMRANQETRPSLLLRIRDRSDQDSWTEFVEIYAPLVYSFLRKRGLQDADAADLVQDVMGTVARTAKSFDYQPSRGSFRRWLFTVVQNRLRNFYKSRASHPGGTGGTRAYLRLNREVGEATHGEELWEREYERRLFRHASEQVRRDFNETTWQAFWQTAMEGQPAAEAAKQLGMSRAAVYLAKSRVLRRIKEHVALLNGDQL